MNHEKAKRSYRTHCNVTPENPLLLASALRRCLDFTFYRDDQSRAISSLYYLLPRQDHDRPNRIDDLEPANQTTTASRERFPRSPDGVLVLIFTFNWLA